MKLPLNAHPGRNGIVRDSTVVIVMIAVQIARPAVPTDIRTERQTRRRGIGQSQGQVHGAVVMSQMMGVAKGPQVSARQIRSVHIGVAKVVAVDLAAPGQRNTKLRARLPELSARICQSL